MWTRGSTDAMWKRGFTAPGDWLQISRVPPTGLTAPGDAELKVVRHGFRLRALKRIIMDKDQFLTASCCFIYIMLRPLPIFAHPLYYGSRTSVSIRLRWRSPWKKVGDSRKGTGCYFIQSTCVPTYRFTYEKQFKVHCYLRKQGN